MKQLTELQEKIAASLFMEPGTFDELMERDFLHNHSEQGVMLLLRTMEIKGWIFQRKDFKYHTYRKFARSKRMAQYGLD